MGMFPICFQKIKLTVGGSYLICNGGKIKEVVFRQSSGRGFSFFDSNTGKKLGKGHLYPEENIRTERQLTFNDARFRDKDIKDAKTFIRS
jgi:hypothetical protein